MKNNLHRRFLETTIREALSDTPVVLIHGSRQCGKTTLARHIGDADGYEYITLDDQNQLVAAQTDPIGFLTSSPT